VIPVQARRAPLHRRSRLSDFFQWGPGRRTACSQQKTAGLTGAPDAPTVEEVGGWIESFATRRGGRSTDWIRAAWAAAAWSLAYNARCDELLGADATTRIRRLGDKMLINTVSAR